MGSPSELSLDCNANSYSLLVKSVGDQIDQTKKLEEFLERLEEERLKIDAFKRELPLCMQLLNNAMEAYRQQLETFQNNQGSKPVLEEFISLKQPSSEGLDLGEKASWMTSTQLWSQTNTNGTKHQNQHQLVVSTLAKDADHGSSKLGLDKKPRNGGAFLPFSKDRNTCTTTPTIRALPELALSSLDKDMDVDKKCMEGANNNTNNNNNTSATTCINNCNKGGGTGSAISDQVKGSAAEPQATTAATGVAAPAAGSTATTQTHRKARRCWSPDLHRRFVNALQMLGGSQVATPKQIRELMKVDGLTNDEVKSHLQKYRLHTRRPCSSPQVSATAAPQLVVLGSIWVPPEYAAAHGAPAALYGPHASAHYCPPPVPQDFYPTPPHHHHHFQHFQPHPPTHNSPDSEVRDAGNRSESIEEEGKSESSSWKGGESGENDEAGGGAKGLLSLREAEGGDHESKGGEISLKF